MVLLQYELLHNIQNIEKIGNGNLIICNMGDIAYSDGRGYIIFIIQHLMTGENVRTLMNYNN